MQLWRTLGTEWLLEQWGAWARIPDDGQLGYPSQTNFAKYLGSGIKTPEIEIDMALAVDRIVKLSAMVNPNYQTAIVSRYVKKHTQIQMSKQLHTSRREAVEILHKAEAWVDGYLHSVQHSFEILDDLQASNDGEFEDVA